MCVMEWGAREVLMRVLLIEDDTETAAVYRKIFSKNNMVTEIVTVSAFEMARDKCASLDFDVVICDHHTQGVNSHSVFNELKRQTALGRFFVVTGDETVKALPGMAGVIRKPACRAIAAIAFGEAKIPAREYERAQLPQ